MGRIAFLIGLCLVIYFSLATSGAMPGLVFWDKAQHAIAYGALAIAGLIGFRGLCPGWLICLGLLALGAGLEIAQLQIGGRFGSVADAAANAAGIAAGFLVAAAVSRLAARRAGARRDR